MSFKEAFELPLKVYWGKVYTKDNGMAFDFCGPWEGYTESKKEFQYTIVKSINGEEEFKIDYPLTYDESYIKLGDKNVISIRGWGYLTSPNCLGLSEKEAARIQDEFAEYIIKKIS